MNFSASYPESTNYTTYDCCSNMSLQKDKKNNCECTGYTACKTCDNSPCCCRESQKQINECLYSGCGYAFPTSQCQTLSHGCLSKPVETSGTEETVRIFVVRDDNISK